MSGHAGLGKVLSRWREGVVRVFDIVPAELLARPPRVGLPVMLGVGTYISSFMVKPQP